MRANGVSIGLVLVIGLLCMTNSTQTVEASSFNALEPIPSIDIDEFVQSLEDQLIWENLGQVGNLETDFYCEFDSGFVCFDMGQVEIWTTNDQSPILLDFAGLQQTHPIGVHEALPLSHFFLGDRGTFTGVKSYHAVEYYNSDIGCRIRFIPIANGLRLEVISDASIEELVSVSNPTKLDIQFKSSQLNRLDPVISDVDSENSMMMEYELIVDSSDSSFAPITHLETDFTPSQPGVNYTYSTYFGGSSTEYSFDIDVDSDDNVYFCGRTHSSDFPILNGSDSSMGGDRDCFVAKFSPNGDLLYSTYIGGSSYEAGGGSSIAVDAQGNVYLATDTHSSDFPTVNAIDPSYNGDYDVVVCKLNSSGDSLIYSTYLGSSRRDLPESIAVH
ncbi:MAG: SBBP repeat-containing protein, partial [Candidatus Thorarchaeota archaeon]